MNETEKNLLKLEIHGIDVELDVRRHQHYVEVTEIERLEAARDQLVARLDSQQDTAGD